MPRTLARKKRGCIRIQRVGAYLKDEDKLDLEDDIKWRWTCDQRRLRRSTPSEQGDHFMASIKEVDLSFGQFSSMLVAPRMSMRPNNQKSSQ